MAKKKTQPKKKKTKRGSKLISFFDIKQTRTRKRIVFLAVISAFFIWTFWNIPLPTNLGNRTYPVSTKIFDRNGELIYEIYANEKRTPVELNELPQHVKDATIAIEDKDFYKHYGFSVTGMSRAAYKIIFRQQLEGGSTLTQQLVKNSLLTPQRTIKRKVREFALSMFTESIYTKDQILEMYLNQIPYGGTAYGIEAASELYFNKSAKDLTLSETALLAGLPQSPTRYSPFGANPQLAKGRQEQVLNRMVEDGYISKEDADAAKEQELSFAKPEELKAPHFALWVKQQLADEYGDAVVEQGGLRVTTTLDLELQEFAQKAVFDEVANLSSLKVGNGAALVTRPASGEILAMVGSKDYMAEDEDGKVNIILSERQPGSSIKPLNYALGIKNGKITASTAFADTATCFSIPGQRAYCPRNYDYRYHGLVQTRYALGNSYNIPAVKALSVNGVDNFVEFAGQMGITTFRDPSNYGLSLTLGGGEVRPYDMAVAFGVFANGGIKQPLVSILKVEDYKGKVYKEINADETNGDRVLSREVAFIISHILSDNSARMAAFGPRSLLNVEGHPEVSVKTGTTNDLRDNWTIGYTGHAVVVVWVGNNDNAPMSGAVSGVSGASPIWNNIIKEVLAKSESGYFNKNDKGHAAALQPDGVVGANICSDIGTLPPGGPEDPGCPVRFEYFIKGTVPPPYQGLARQIGVDKTTDKLSDENTPAENVELRDHRVYFDPTGEAYCLDCNNSDDTPDEADSD